MKLADVLKQADVTLKAGDYLASLTRSEGYVPTHRDTQMVHLGRYVYKIVGVGSPDEGGNYESLKIVPVVLSEDGKEFVDDLEHPIVVQEPGKVTYMTGRNHPEYKDGYHGRQFYSVENVPAGQEHRQALTAFIEFVNSEFSMGVNDFQIGGPELLQA